MVLPIAIGIAVCVWLFQRDYSAEVWRSIHFDSRAILGILLALAAVVGRDFGLTWRFHTLGGGDLNWRRSMRVDLMCAFTSAITPSVVGGSALAIFYLNKEGIKVGRATSLTLATLFLDEMFFVIFCPIIILLVPAEQLFDAGVFSDETTFLEGVKLVFWLVYAGICVWAAILYFAIIGRPEAMSRLLEKVSRWKIWGRKGEGLKETARNMLATSKWIKGQSAQWWLNIFGGTVLSWFSRYLIVNALFWGFVPEASPLMVFARQFVVWVVLMVSPTPGGSGVSEWLFTNYYGDLIGSLGIALVLAMFWRILSYYIYLIAGSIMIPSYFKKK